MSQQFQLVIIRATIQQHVNLFQDVVMGFLKVGGGGLIGIVNCVCVHIL